MTTPDKALSREEVEKLDEDILAGGSPLAAGIILKLKRMALKSIDQDEQMKWRPIETAPKDGSWIQIAFVDSETGQGEHPRICYWDKDGNYWWTHDETSDVVAWAWAPSLPWPSFDEAHRINNPAPPPATNPPHAA